MRLKAEKLKDLVLSEIRKKKNHQTMQRMGGRKNNERKYREKKKKRKKKKKKKKKKKQQKKGHPRKQLKFDDSCECGVAPKPKRHSGLWVWSKMCCITSHQNYVLSNYIHCDVQRVVNGDQAELGSHPWAGYSKKFNFLACKKNLPHSVSLERDSGAYFCGGSIISNRFGGLMC